MNNQANAIRCFYYFILGAFGGVTGWFIHALAFRGVEDLQLGTLMIRGAILGALIGVSIAAYEPIASRSARRYIRLGGYGLLLGVLAGGVALPLAQLVFSKWFPSSRGQAGILTTQSFLVGTACWTILGGVIGFTEVAGKGTQSYKGLLGGIVGGVVGGGIYEAARTSGYAGETYRSQTLQALSLGLMGGSIGASVALITTLLRSAWMEVLDGKFATHEYDVTKYVSRDRGGRGVRGIIGSDEYRANVFLPADNEILPQHAILCYANEAPTMLATDEARKVKAKILVNDHPVYNTPLSHGDTIQIGTTRLLYHQSRKRV
jgi:hypothetical protein